jgi:hypothetical protein
MHKKIFYMVIAFVITMTSCKKDVDNTDYSNVVNSIYATFGDGSGFFIPESTTPYTDTIKFVFSTHFPAESNNPIDIKSVLLKANAPTSVKVVATGSNEVDLTKPTEIVIREPNGNERKFIVIGDIRKNKEAKITSFSLPSINMEGIVLETKKLVGLVAGEATLTNQVPRITITPHATISPALTAPQDFSKAVTYTVTSESGIKVNYTVKPVTPQKVASGIRPGSVKMLWTKSLVELGVTGVDLTTSVAVSDKFLMVNTRANTNIYLDRFTGAALGTVVPTPVASTQFPNFFATSDEGGQIFVTNLVNGLPNTLQVYKYKSVTDQSPELYISWPSTLYRAGRKMSIKGDVTKNALIFMGSPSSGNTILRWQVVNGTLVSQTPSILTYGGSKVWTLMADVISTGTDITDNYFIAAQGSDIAYVNTTNHQPLSVVDLATSGIATTHSLDYVDFNNAKYLAVLNVTSGVAGNAFLYNVTNPLLLSTLPTSADYAKVLTFKTPVLSSPSNGNLTGDVALKVSKDGYKMVMYALTTNGSIAAYEFDCIDLASIN